MPEADIDLLAINRGTVTAPAGCGKTQRIADALSSFAGTKPVLVLTHTNAGVAALRSRLDRAGVPSRAYRLSTIDGWAMKLVATFPSRSGHDRTTLALANPKADYPRIRKAAVRLLSAGHIDDVLTASYARVIVDEYQDCSVDQHTLIACATKGLPVCVLGDPMQAIFDFGSNRLANWIDEVCTAFPVVGELTTPWRWINAGTEPLGRWLLDARTKLIRGDPIDLRTYKEGVSWIELDGTEDHVRRLRAARFRSPGGRGSVLIIAASTSPNSQQAFASQTPGAITVEAVDLRDLVAFARDFDLGAPDAVIVLVKFAQSVMTNVGAGDFVQRARSLARGTAKRAATDAESAAVTFLSKPTHGGAVDLLVEISKQAGVRTHRPAVLRACIKALRLCSGSDGVSLLEAAMHARELNRLLGRPLPKRAVGSTLLLKGLEADVVVILNAIDLNARNLYVAMTRGSSAVVICSPVPMLNPT